MLHANNVISTITADCRLSFMMEWKSTAQNTITSESNITHIIFKKLTWKCQQNHKISNSKNKCEFSTVRWQIIQWWMIHYFYYLSSLIIHLFIYLPISNEISQLSIVANQYYLLSVSECARVFRIQSEVLCHFSSRVRKVHIRNLGKSIPWLHDSGKHDSN